MSPLLEASSISMRAGGKMLLNRISLSFEFGETVAIIGPSGAGKSTLLRALSGEIKPQSGDVRLNGKPIGSYAPHLLALHRAVLSQQTNTAFPFTVAEIVRMGANHGRGPEIDTTIDDTLAELDLLVLADRIISSLSGGEQQRVHFARVLVQLTHGRNQGGCGVMLLDEPTASLDLHHQLRMLQIAKRLAWRGALVIGTFHDLNLAALFADRVVVLDGGHIDSQGRPDDAITNAMLARVFAIEAAVGQVPSIGMPFVLPQVMAVVRAVST